MPNSTQTTTTFYLVRHGETQWNKEGRLQGQKNSDLTSQGVAMVETLARTMQSLPVAAIYSSDLGRALQTAQILAKAHHLTVIESKEIRERTFGEYDGWLRQDFKEKTKELWKKFEKLPDHKKRNFSFATGYESDNQIVKRLENFLFTIAPRHKNQTVVVVTHGAILRTFLSHLGILPAEMLIPGAFENAGFVKVKYDGVQYTVLEVSGIKKKIGYFPKNR